MQPAPRRRIPRIATIIVPLAAVAIAAFLVSLAWRSDTTARTTATDEPAPDVLVASNVFLNCTDCHGDLDRLFKEGQITNLLFTHEMHFETGVSDCSVCHPANTHVPDRINKPTMSRCFTCHGTDPGSIAPGTCSTCHPKDMPEIPETHLTGGWLPDQHAQAALVDQFECLTCHQQRFCTACHGLPMPHPANWDEGNHEALFFEDQNACQQCHVRVSGERDFCDSCHHPRGPKDEGWIDAHPEVVTASGAFTCFECHSTQTCSSCHIDGEETYEADEQFHRPTPSPSTGSA